MIPNDPRLIGRAVRFVEGKGGRFYMHGRVAKEGVLKRIGPGAKGIVVELLMGIPGDLVGVKKVKMPFINKGWELKP